MRLFTTTVLNASTDPSPLKITGRSRVSAFATQTDTLMDPRSWLFLPPPAACGFGDEVQPASNATPAITPSQQINHGECELFNIQVLSGQYPGRRPDKFQL